MRESLSWRVLGATALLALMIAGTFLLQLNASNEAAEALRDSAVEDATIAASSDLESDLVAMEAGTRGVMITGHAFFAPYHRAMQDYPGDLRRLDELVGGEPAPERAFAEIKQRAEMFVAGYLRPLVRRIRRAPKSVDRKVELAQGASQIGVLRDQFERLNQLEQEEAKATADTAQSSASRASSLGRIGVMGTLVLLATFSLYLVVRVLRPVRRLSAAADRIAAGDLSARVRPTRGETELDRMGTSFNEMAESVEGGRRAMLEAEQTKDEFFALVSHELRTPLTSIIGYLEALIEPDAADLPEEKRLRFLRVMNRNARRLLRLVGDLLFVARAEAGQVEFSTGPFDLSEVARESIDTFRPRAEAEGLELNSEIGEVATCIGDAGRIGQAIDNLLSNALKFTQAGGEVSLRLRSNGRRQATIEVTDTGIGIPEEEQRELFELFYRTAGAKQNSIEGSGLGLGIVKTIVDGHAGEIELESAEGKGTTFRINLPLDVGPSSGK